MTDDFAVVRRGMHRCLSPGPDCDCWFCLAMYALDRIEARLAAAEGANKAMGYGRTGWPEVLEMQRQRDKARADAERWRSMLDEVARVTAAGEDEDELEIVYEKVTDDDLPCMKPSHADLEAQLKTAERDCEVEVQATMVAIRAADKWRADAERLAEALRPFAAFQDAGYMAGHPFEETYALLVKAARAALAAREEKDAPVRRCIK